MGEKITVIIPVYNTGKYLDKCIGSVTGQTYKNLEIILIDDGSTDNSYEICKQWAQRDNRIVLRHKENGGLSSARNAGLDQATGEFVAFVDSDDWIEPDMYEVMLNAILRSGKDVALCKIGQGQWPDDDMYTAIVRDREGSQLVKFLFASHLWDNIRMPLGRYAEDAAVLHEVLYQRSIELVDRSFYHYYWDNPNNISNVPHNALKNTMDRAIVFMIRYQWMLDKDIDRESQMIVLGKSVSFFIGAMGLYYAKKSGRFRDDVAALLDFSRTHYWEIISSRYLSFGRKVAVSIICVSPKLYYRIRNIKIVDKAMLFQ